MKDHFFCMKVLDENGNILVQHVSNDEHECVNQEVDHPDVPIRAWNSCASFIKWVNENKPEWKIQKEYVPYLFLFNNLSLCK